MSDLGYQGTQRPSDDAGGYNAQKFLITALLNQMNIGTLVKVTAVTNSGGLDPVGFVDVQPLVNQLTGDGTKMPHAEVYNLPYFRLQGGTDAIIIDPKVGDIGIAVFADRDISSVKANKAQANPGSGRRNDMADGLYIGGVLNGTPEQYIQYNGSGIKMFSPTRVRIEAPLIELHATTSIKSDAPLIQSDASASIVENAPLITNTAPLIGLNGALTQTAGAGTGVVTMIGPVNVQQQIKSNTEVVAVTTPLHTHVHINGGGTGNSGLPTP